MGFRDFTDQMGRVVTVPQKPQRIISLVPSQTELLFDLGLGDKIVGITRFCIHPNTGFKSKIKIGGTKKLDLQKIKTLDPDLIIGNKEENSQDDIIHLSQEFPVWMSDISTYPHALEMIRMIGELNSVQGAARALITEIGNSFQQLIPVSEARTVAYFIWKNPYMLAGTDTFIDDILRMAGFRNIAGKTRYPEIDPDALCDLNPDLIFLSSEPYPFAAKHIAEIKMICPHSQVIIVDGEMFSWYGSRLRYTAAYLQNLVNKILKI